MRLGKTMSTPRPTLRPSDSHFHGSGAIDNKALRKLRYWKGKNEDIGRGKKTPCPQAEGWMINYGQRCQKYYTATN